jgi:hypothetical protein
MRILGISLAMAPLKMMCRWLLNVKYWNYIPEYFWNVPPCCSMGAYQLTTVSKTRPYQPSPIASRRCRS